MSDEGFSGVPVLTIVEAAQLRTDLATARQDAERARGLLRLWFDRAGLKEAQAAGNVYADTVEYFATPTPGPVPGRGLDPLTVEACAKEVESCRGMADKADERTLMTALAWRIRSLTSPADTKGRPDNGK